MSVLVEMESGAQVLPNIGDERQTFSSWSARCACDADLRTRSKVHRDLAARLVPLRLNASEADRG